MLSMCFQVLGERLGVTTVGGWVASRFSKFLDPWQLEWDQMFFFLKLEYDWIRTTAILLGVVLLLLILGWRPASCRDLTTARKSEHFKHDLNSVCWSGEAAQINLSPSLSWCICNFCILIIIGRPRRELLNQFCWTKANLLNRFLLKQQST